MRLERRATSVLRVSAALPLLPSVRDFLTVAPLATRAKAAHFPSPAQHVVKVSTHRRNSARASPKGPPRHPPVVRLFHARRAWLRMSVAWTAPARYTASIARASIWCSASRAAPQAESAFTVKCAAAVLAGNPQIAGNIARGRWPGSVLLRRPGLEARPIKSAHRSRRSSPFAVNDGVPAPAMRQDAALAEARTRHRTYSWMVLVDCDLRALKSRKNPMGK